MRDPDKVIAVYILANRRNGTIHTGVTADLSRRVHDLIAEAIRREKQIKKYPRAWKVRLIEAMNPHWVDLYNKLNS